MSAASRRRRRAWRKVNMPTILAAREAVAAFRAMGHGAVTFDRTAPALTFRFDGEERVMRLPPGRDASSLTAAELAAAVNASAGFPVARVMPGASVLTLGPQGPHGVGTFSPPLRVEVSPYAPEPRCPGKRPPRPLTRKRHLRRAGLA